MGEIIDDPCPACKGTGKTKKVKKISVKIPKGADNGLRLKVRGEGEGGTRGGPAGDLYVVVHVEPHELFERGGDDILYELPITFSQAALGDDVMVPTLHGKVKMSIKAGTQTHSILRLKGKGMPHLHGRGQGDQLVRVIVETPVNLSSEQKDLFKKFAELEKGVHGNHTKGGKGIFEKVKDAFDS